MSSTGNVVFTWGVDGQEIKNQAGFTQAFIPSRNPSRCHEPLEQVDTLLTT